MSGATLRSRTRSNLVRSDAEIESRALLAAHWTRALLAAALMLAVLPGVAGGAVPVPAPPRVLDGPSPSIAGVSGLSVARDGTGGLAYLKEVGGVQHVFVSALTGGVFQAPVEIDGAFGGPSSQPVIAAGARGLLLVGFINDGGLYVVRRPRATAAYGSPVGLFAGAANPALALNESGKGYLAFAAAGPGGHDLRTAYYDNGSWALESGALDAVPADDAGAGAGRPEVAVAGDGVAIVAWGEAGHVYSRRVWGTSPSVVAEQADVPSLSGRSEVSANLPGVGTGGDSSYAAVAFHETFSGGLLQQQSSRVLERRLRASQYDPVVAADGLSTPAAGGATDPQIAIDEYGQGLVSSARVGSNQLVALVLGNNGAAFGVQRVDSALNLAPPNAVPARAGYHDGLIAWQQDPGSAGQPEIRARFYNGSSFDNELVLSSPASGPAAAARGLAAAGDIAADVAVAWVQGAGSSAQIVTAQLYQPPGPFGAPRPLGYARTKQPVLAWTAPRAPWGPLRYVVSVDGNQIGATTATSLRAPFPLAHGPHVLQITAVNPAGLQSSSRPATVWVDLAAPKIRVTLTGSRRVGSRLHLHVRVSGERRPASPGIAKVVVEWGDGSSSRISARASHVYPRPGRYRLTVVVTDRAGNRTAVVQRLVIGR